MTKTLSISTLILDSILSEFGALDEEPVSEKPFFEPSVPVMDTSKKSDQAFPAAANDGFGRLRHRRTKL